MNDNPYSRRAPAALVISPDPLTAALVGAGVEIAGFRAEFARSGESSKESVRRVRPSHILFDCDDPASRDEAALGPSLMTGARLFFFGSAHRLDEVRALAARHRGRLIVLPDDITRLREILTRRPSPSPEQVAG